MAKNSDNIVNKSVSFNLSDPDHQADYDFAMKRKNFSAFCRTLIRMERLRQENGITAVVPLSTITDPEPKEDDVADEDSILGML